MHEWRWNLQMQMRDGDGDWMDPGPRAIPGRYTATLSLDGVDTAAMTDFEVLIDPRAEISRADLMARHEAMIDSYRLGAVTGGVFRALSRAADQVEAAEDHLAGVEGADSALVARVDAAMARLDEIEEALGDADNGAGAWFGIQSMHAPATELQLAAIEDSWTELPGVVADLNDFVQNTLPPLMADVMSVGVEAPEPVDPVTMPSRGGMD